MYNLDCELFDAKSLASALRLHPDDFAMRGQYVLHLPTGLQFTFAPGGQSPTLKPSTRPIVLLRFQPQEQPDLYQAFERWRSSYWQIIEQNERAHSPFAPRGWRHLRRKIANVLRLMLNKLDLPIIPGS